MRLGPIAIVLLLTLPVGAAAPEDCVADPRRCELDAKTPVGVSADAGWELRPANPTASALDAHARSPDGGVDAQRTPRGNYTLNVDARDNGLTIAIDEQGQVKVS